MRVEASTAALVLEHYRGPARGHGVAVAPLHQRDDRGPQVEALFGEEVFEALGALLVAAPFQHAVLEQTLQARVEDVARDAEVALQLVEATQPEEDVADDEQRPALADHLECAGDAAGLVLVVVAEHLTSISQRVASCNSSVLGSVASCN